MTFVCWGCLQARLGNTQTVQDLLKLTETLQAEKRRLQGREQKDGSEKQRLQQALADVRAATSRLKVGLISVPQSHPKLLCRGHLRCCWQAEAASGLDGIQHPRAGAPPLLTHLSGLPPCKALLVHEQGTANLP